MNIDAINNVLQVSFPAVYAQAKPKPVTDWIQLERDVTQALAMFKHGRVEAESALMLIDAIQCYHTGRGTVLDWNRK
jgi:hypothetical protein